MVSNDASLLGIDLLLLVVVEADESISSESELYWVFAWLVLNLKDVFCLVSFVKRSDKNSFEKLDRDGATPPAFKL